MGSIFVLNLLAASQAYASNPLVFTDPTLTGGTDFMPGAEYTYSQVIPNVDFVLTVDQFLNGASLTDTDGIGAGGTGDDDLFASMRGWPAGPGPGFVAYSLNFYQSGSMMMTPATFANLNLSAYNFSSGFDSIFPQNMQELFSTTLVLNKSEVAGMPTPRNPSIVEVVDSPTFGSNFWEIRLVSNLFNSEDIPGIEDMLQEDLTVDFSYENVSSIMFYWGLTGTSPQQGPTNFPEFDDNGKDRAVFLTGDGVLVPIPPAVWLFASALGMLGLLKRKSAELN